MVDRDGPREILDFNPVECGGRMTKYRIFTILGNHLATPVIIVFFMLTTIAISGDDVVSRKIDLVASAQSEIPSATIDELVTVLEGDEAVLLADVRTQSGGSWNSLLLRAGWPKPTPQLLSIAKQTGELLWLPKR
jgi:hypothetical protein